MLYIPVSMRSTENGAKSEAVAAEPFADVSTGLSMAIPLLMARMLLIAGESDSPLFSK